MSIASAVAKPAPTAAPISSSKYGKCHLSGDSTTPSREMKKPFDSRVARSSSRPRGGRPSGRPTAGTPRTRPNALAAQGRSGETSVEDGLEPAPIGVGIADGLLEPHRGAAPVELDRGDLVVEERS